MKNKMLTINILRLLFIIITGIIINIIVNTIIVSTKVVLEICN